MNHQKIGAQKDSPMLTGGTAPNPIDAPEMAFADNWLSGVLGDVGAAVFQWRADDDSMHWSGNAAAMLGLDSLQEIGLGRFFHARLAEDGELLRMQAIESAARSSNGRHRYKTHYRFQVGSETRDESLWLEEIAHCVLDDNGRIRHVQGMVRIVEDPRVTGAMGGQFERDDLTGFYAREFFIKLFDLLIADAKRQKLQATFFVACIDNLKVINDAFGFDVADQVIATMAGRVGECLRKNDVIGRIAGNKFGFCLRNCDIERAKMAAERILERVNSGPVQTSVGDVQATVSLGGVVVPRHARSSEEAISFALEALSDSREGRRGAFKLYEPSAKRDADRKLNVEIANDLIGALSDERLHVALQPIVHARDGSVAFHEGLARILTRHGEVLPAGGFMGFAERLGLVQIVDKRVLDLALTILAEEPETSISINVSVPTIADLEWFNQLARTILKDRSVAQRLIVEITETEAIGDIEATKTFVASLHDLGCRVALDDFGAGFTSYRNLRDLGVDIVKIDGSFMTNLGRSEPDQMFVRTLIGLAKSMNIETVAEWVQTPQDAELLRQWGVHYLQGRLFGDAKLRSKASPGKTSSADDRPETQRRHAKADQSAKMTKAESAA